MSQRELIELQNLPPAGRVELVSPCPVVKPGHGSGKVRAVRLVGDGVTLEGAGEGHVFQAYSHVQPTWCDLCGDFIWGLFKQSLRCRFCKFTCHYRCRAFIKLDCSVKSRPHIDQSDFVDDTIEADTNVCLSSVKDQPAEWRARELTFTELQQKVKEHNVQVNADRYMVLNKDGSYTGVITVQFRPVRPVSVLSTKETGLRHCIPLYLPQADAAIHLHISSFTRAADVIQALLSTYSLVDNPGKFALFERREHNDQVYWRKLANAESPLLLWLCVGPSEKNLNLVLKENETGEINWEAFSEPELHNFLRILQHKEEERVRKVVERYARVREHLMTAMMNCAPG